MGGVAVTLTLDDIPTTWDSCQTEINMRQAMQSVAPRVRVWQNAPTGQEYRGIIQISELRDSSSGQFKRNKRVTDPGPGTITMPTTSQLAQFLFQLPNNNAAKRGIIITVDYMGGKYRWSGVLKSWTLKGQAGQRQVVATFICDSQFLQYLLGAPNPLLPIPIFQFPRVLPVFGPAKWAVSLMILLNLIRIEGNLWNLPQDPFDVGAWSGLFNWSSWQILIKANPFNLDDSSVWSLVATRMTRMDQAISDAMEDGELVLRYRRILTVDGETSDVPGVPNVRNGALVLEIVDASGYYNPNGTFLGGNFFTGLGRSITGFASGFVEDVYTAVADSEAYTPDQYFQPGYVGTLPARPGVLVIDSPWTQIDTLELSWQPATAVSVIVGGDNPLADALAQLLIESVGSLLGYFLLGGFSGLGSIASSVIMPFLVGTIAAWLQWTNNSRANAIGWVHFPEIYSQGAESNAWSLSAVSALRAGFRSTKSKTSHTFTMGGSGRWLPGYDYQIGDRVASTVVELQGLTFVDQVESMDLSWDWTSDKGVDFQTKVGGAEAALSQAERNARLVQQLMATAVSVGVHLTS